MTSPIEHKSLPWYFQLAVLYYIFHTTIPVFGHYTPAVVHAAMVFFLCIFTLIYSSNFKYIAKVLPIFSISLLSICYFGLTNIVVELYGLIQIALYPILALFIIDRYDERVVKRLFWLSMASYMLTAITTYFGCILYPGAARFIATDLAGTDPILYSLYKSANIGNFSFIYTLVLLLPVMVFLLRTRQVNVTIALSMIVIIALTIVQTEYTAALLLTCLSLSLFFLPKNIQLKHLLMLVGIALLFFTFGKILVGGALIQFSSFFSDSDTFSSRLYDLGAALSGQIAGSDNSDIDSRKELYTISLDAFFASPLWGGSSRVGAHSFFCDNLGRFGVIGLVAMVIMYKRMYKLFYLPFVRKPFFGYIFFSFLLALIMAIINPKDNIGVLSLTIPLFALAYKNKN